MRLLRSLRAYIQGYADCVQLLSFPLNHLILPHALCTDSTVWLEEKRFEAGTSKETIEEWWTVVRLH